MKRKNEKGSALLVAVVVMLILSGVGMGIIALTDTDTADTSWNSHAKNAMYVAEIGLRRGEAVLAATAATAIDPLLQNTSTASTPVVTPNIPVFPTDPTQYDLTRLGTYLVSGGVQLANQQVTLPASPTGRPLPDAFYSLYVRNNPNDVNVADFNAGTAATQDDDFTVNLVSVAWVAKAGNVLAVKILEEEYAWAGIDQDPSSQKLKDAGGTSSAQFGG
jgi:hypothetical protein